MIDVVLIIILLLVIGACVWLFMQRMNLLNELNKYQSIKDIDAYVKAEKEKIDELKRNSEIQFKKNTTANQNLTKVNESLTREINEKKELLAIFNENLDLTEFGIYQPIFDFDTPEKYKEKIKEVKEEQKKMIKDKIAITGGENWTIDGSAAKGQQMVDKQKKLMMRAFNGESDTLISKVTYSNIEKILQRLDKLFEQVNKLGSRLRTEIAVSYLECKKKELRLVHEHKEKLQQHKEEQRKIKEQMREEQKAEKERQKAIKEAEKMEQIQEQALEKARKELESATKEQQDKLLLQITQLEEALEATKRKKSQAELTKTGHIYIISNIGSFGEGVYKIGMTRRLEPLDRVKELSNASVPFNYDVHAMITTSNAPELETKLHRYFENKRINKVNKRREFFRTSLDEIESAIVEITGKEEDFVKTHAAREYKESISIQSLEAKKTENISSYNH